MSSDDSSVPLGYARDIFDLSGRVAVITGGDGLGRASRARLPNRGSGGGGAIAASAYAHSPGSAGQSVGTRNAESRSLSRT